MVTVLILFGLSVVLSVATGVVLAAAFRAGEVTAPRVSEAPRAVGPAQFFDDSIQPPAPSVRTAIPLELLLLQIAEHIRLEQAAAESFHQYPTVESLHRHTSSPLIH